MRVGWAQKNTSLCVGGLNPSVTTDMLVREFGRFGPLDKDLTTIKPGGENEPADLQPLLPPPHPCAKKERLPAVADKAV